jgi:hypothetical protein
MSTFMAQNELVALPGIAPSATVALTQLQLAETHVHRLCPSLSAGNVPQPEVPYLHWHTVHAPHDCEEGSIQPH